MGANKLFGVGLVVVLAVGLAGCTFANPDQVSSIATSVKKLDLKSLGGVLCEDIYRPSDVGSTVTYERTIAVRGASNVPELLDRLKKAGFPNRRRAHEIQPGRDLLIRTGNTSAVVLSVQRDSRGQKYKLGDKTSCTVPANGLAVIGFEPADH
jgi:hypothetical protein